MLRFKNTNYSYGIITQSFHWIIVLLLLGMYPVGIYMESLDPTPQKLNLYFWHKSFGSLLLMLIILRLSWRFINKTPKLPDNLGKVHHIGAPLFHYMLYGFLFLIPICGWMMSSTANFPVSFFGLFTLPTILGPDKALNHLFHDLHSYGAYTLLGFIVLHIAAGLFHHFYYKNDILRRMLNFNYEASHEKS